jgi:uncharacterized protein YegL
MTDELHPHLADVDLGGDVNREPRCPCVLVLDTSSSMSEGGKIDHLQEGLGVLAGELKEDSLARRRVEVAVITFGGVVRVVQPFVSAADFIAPPLSAQGGTPMGEAVLAALDMVARRKEDYKRNGLDYYQPWVFMLTDGQPTDPWEAAARSVHELEDARRVNFFAVGVGDDAQLDVLAGMSRRSPRRLAGLRFSELFAWLSRSLVRVSSAEPGGRVQPPATDDWAEAIV